MLMIRRILHATDYSDLSHPAFEMACSLARDFGAELVICHVSPPPIAAVANGVIVDIPTGEAEQLRARLEKVKPDDPRLSVTHQLLRGDPGHARPRRALAAPDRKRCRTCVAEGAVSGCDRQASSCGRAS